jgi:predicted amidophosphoribosyltransferase
MKIPVPPRRDNSGRGRVTGETVCIGMNCFPEVRIRLCHMCGRLFRLRDEGQGSWGICPDCRHDLEISFAPFELPRIDGYPDLPFIALSRYESPVPALMEAIKLRRHFRLLHFVAVTALLPVLSSIPGTVIPLPASIHGRRKRGFDQTRVLARYCRRPVSAVVGRRRGAEQKHLSREARSSNAERSLYLRRSPPAGGIVLDDVCTTGATVIRAVGLLDAAGDPPAAIVVVSART